jgi:hypothetical protein
MKKVSGVGFQRNVTEFDGRRIPTVITFNFFSLSFLFLLSPSLFVRDDLSVLGVSSLRISHSSNSSTCLND